MIIKLLIITTTLSSMFDRRKYYRLTTKFTGPKKSLDIINDRKDNKLIMANTGNFSGQMWKITKINRNYYRITSKFTGAKKSLDIVNDRNDNKLIMANTGNFSGQMWKIT